MRWNSIFAQPQYGPTNASSWLFKGFYYFGAPGRIGMRAGNPGFPAFKATPKPKRAPIKNGQTAYINSLPTFHTGSDICTEPVGTYTLQCQVYGWDIDRSEGVWTECQDKGLRTAYANFLGVGYANPTNPTNQIRVWCATCANSQGAFVSINPNYRFAWNTLNDIAAPQDPAEIVQHNCTTCTGKWNYHNRVGVSVIDEGPQDTFQDPYNPWSFSLSITYPTYINTSSWDASAYNYSADAQVEIVCDELLTPVSTCPGQAIRQGNQQYQKDWQYFNGYSPSNFKGQGGIVEGRHDQLRARGIHLHYPPENWGASFEPTRALVSLSNTKGMMKCHSHHSHNSGPSFSWVASRWHQQLDEGPYSITERVAGCH